MIEQDFCFELEYKLSKAFSNSADPNIKNLWCDGILLPISDNEISRKNVTDRREIILVAFIGIDGQSSYRLTLKFGNKSLSRYARDRDIKECIPGVTENDWYDIDITNKALTVRLL